MFGMNDAKKKIKLSALENQILDLHGKRREMEIDLANQALDLKNTKRKQEMELEEERHSHKLALKEKDLDLARATKNSREDSERKIKAAQEDKERAITELETQSEMELLKTRTMMKLEAEQKIAKACLEAEKKVILKDSEISDLKKVHAENMANQKSELTKEHYDNLKVNLEKFHSEGNTTTKFMQDISMEMLRNKPVNDLSVGIETRALEAKSDG